MFHYINYDQVTDKQKKKFYERYEDWKDYAYYTLAHGEIYESFTEDYAYDFNFPLFKPNHLSEFPISIRMALLDYMKSELIENFDHEETFDDDSEEEWAIEQFVNSFNWNEDGEII